MLGLLTRRTSRNKMDCDRNDEEYAKNVFKMSGQAWWLDGERKTVPSSETVYLSREYELECLTE